MQCDWPGGGTASWWRGSRFALQPRSVVFLFTPCDHGKEEDALRARPRTRIAARRGKTLSLGSVSPPLCFGCQLSFLRDFSLVFNPSGCASNFWLTPLFFFLLVGRSQIVSESTDVPRRSKRGDFRVPLQTLIRGGNCARRAVVVVCGCASAALVRLRVSESALFYLPATRIRTPPPSAPSQEALRRVSAARGYAAWTHREVWPRRGRKKMLPVRMLGGHGVALLVFFLSVGRRVASSTGEWSGFVGLLLSTGALPPRQTASAFF